MASPPGKNIVAGNIQPILQTLEIDRSLTEAQRVRLIYKGESEQALRSFDEMARGANRALLRQNGSTTEIELTMQAVPGEVGTPGTSIDTYLVEEVRYSNNQAQISIFESAAFYLLADGDVRDIIATWEQIKEVRAEVVVGQTVAEGEARAIAAANLRLEIEANFVGKYTSVTQRRQVSYALHFLMAEVLPPTVFFPVVIYRKVVAAASTFVLDGGRTGFIFSTANLPVPANRTSDGVPLLGRISTPGVTNSMSLRPNHVAAWLGSVDMNTLSDGTVELTETYTYGVYPVGYYPGTYDAAGVVDLTLGVGL